MFEGHPIKERLGAWTKELPGSRWYVVGGAVRDALLGRAITDIDVLAAGVEPVALARFLEARGSIDFVGRIFGVFKFTPKEGGASIDIALPRRERPMNTGGYRDVAASSDPSMPIEEDLARRDFTVNAMAWEAGEEAIIDPFGGREDLDERTIRAVGDPSARFGEDYTRMLRALRFAAQLGFEIEHETWTALWRLMPHIDDERALRHSDHEERGERLVPYELIAREFMKSLNADPKRAARLWNESGAFGILMPELALDATILRRLALIGAGHAETSVAALFYEQGALHAAETAERLRLVTVDGFRLRPDALARMISLAAQLKGRAAQDWRPSELRKIFLLHEEFGRDVLRLADALGAHVEAYERRLISIRKRCLTPLLDGDQIMEKIIMAPGPKVRKALDLLIDAQAEGKVSTPEEAEEFLKEQFAV
jgi:tRNA nucleotidyltransferase/poly(A) polymerase